MSRRAKALRRPPRDRTSRANTSPRPRRSWSRGASAPRSLVRTGTARGRGNGLRRRGGRRSPAIDEDALHLPRRRAAAASATWQYLLLETSRKLVWPLPAAARAGGNGPPPGFPLVLPGSGGGDRLGEPRADGAGSGRVQVLVAGAAGEVGWTVPASARDRVYGPSAALLLGPAGSRERGRSRRATSRRRSLGESRRACSRSFSTALMAVLAPTRLLPERGLVSNLLS